MTGAAQQDRLEHRHSTALIRCAQEVVQRQQLGSRTWTCRAERKNEKEGEKDARTRRIMTRMRKVGKLRI